MTTSPPSPTSRSTTPSSRAVPVPGLLGFIGGGKVVALTFDDGPGASTGAILDILERFDVHATFCQIGQQVADFPNTEKRITADGDTVCNHTWDHDEDLPARSAAVVSAEIDKAQQAISSATGQTPRWYRAPGGNFGPPAGVVRKALVRRGLHPLDWGVDSEDWQRGGVAKIVSTVMGEVSPGAIILLHDAGGDRRQTVAALPIILDQLRAAGYRVVPLPT